MVPSSSSAVSANSNAPLAPLATMTSSADTFRAHDSSEWWEAMADRASGVPQALTYPAAIPGEWSALVMALIIVGQGGMFRYAVGSPSCNQSQKAKLDDFRISHYIPFAKHIHKLTAKEI